MSKIEINNSKVTIINQNKNGGKFCTKCHIFKAYAGFGKNTKTNDGLKHWCRECFRVYMNKRNEDPNHKIENNMRAKLNRLIKNRGAVKDKKLCALLGIPFDLFMKWYEYTKIHFVPKDYTGMTDHDHFYPLSKFDLTDPEQLKKAMHWSNIRCMTSHDNRAKSNNPPTKSDEQKMKELKQYFTEKYIDVNVCNLLRETKGKIE